MRKKYIFSALLSLFLLVPASITWAQTISSQKGLTTAVFTTSGGNIKVYLPHDIRSNDHISGCVIAEPIGKNAKQTANNLAELKKYSITINNEKFAVDNTTNPFRFLVNADQTKTGLIELINGSGIKAGELTIPSVPEKSLQPAPSQCKIPFHGLTGLPFRITGPFDGNSSNTNCMLDNKPMEILVKSPRECIVLYPPDATGIKTLNVQESGKQLCSQQVSGVQMNISAGKLDLLKGEETYINVSITGLQNLPDTALLTLANITTSVVVMQPSNMIVIALSPDSVGSGTFNKTFNIQSIRTGTFSVNVNLDLPENQPDNPPTQPQPGDHPPTQPQPQPRDSTTTVPQCPKCNCYCSATIIPVEEKDGVSTYRVSVTASCSGQFGPPPCKACGIIDAYEYEWQVSFSAGDGIEHIGSNNGSRFSFRNPKNAPFSLYINVQVKCSDGSKCSCTATMSYEPTVPEEKECQGCQCECSALIYAIDEDGEEREYGVYVNAVVTGDYDIPPCKKCEIIDTTYVWSIDSEDFAKIFGSNIGKKVKLRTIKPGKYVLTVAVTITCSDGHECKCGGTKEGIVFEKLCIFKFEENANPAMDGGLKTASETRIIKRDEYIPLGAEGMDFDNLFWSCTPQKDCKDIVTNKKIPLNGKVRFEWEIYEGEGSFVRIGCLPKSAKNEAGENVVFKPPYVQLPVAHPDTTLTTKIHLTIIDDNLTQKIDPVVDDTIFITTKRSVEKPDEYVVVITDQKKHKPVTKPEESKDPEIGCLAIKKWGKKAKLDKPDIILPAGVVDNTKMVLGEWIVLNTAIRDNDNLAISCSSQNQCPSTGIDLNYEDKIEFTWSAGNIKNPGYEGIFISSNIGSQVIYQAPLEIPAGGKVLTVRIRVKAHNPGPGKVMDDPSDQGEITLEIYQPGVLIQYPSTTWIPDTSQKNLATLISELKYRDQNEIWQPALTHMGRIHFFELLDVSEEKGICMNYPPLIEANECKDLVLKNEEGGKFEAFNSKPLVQKNCTMKDQLLQARTKEAEKEFTLKVYPQDYGAYGFMRSFANTNKDGITETTQNKKAIEALYIPIPWTNEMVQHLRKPYSYKKSYDDPSTKVKIELEYPDNRVTLPYDIDENHIPDNGYPDLKGNKIDEPYWDTGDGEFGDDDNIPVGDGFKGDGLTNYEEYRGFMTMQNVTKKSATENVTVTEPGHVRTNHGIKTLFIHRVHEMLDISLFEEISDLEVYLISEKQYDASDKTFPVKLNDGNPLVAPRRWINFNFTHAEHVIEQWGLKLLDAKFTEKELDGELGIADNTFGHSEVITRPNIPNFEFEIKINTEAITNSCTKKKTVYKDKLAKIVAHELFHGCNICHHGEKPKGKTRDADYDEPKFGGLRSGNLLCVMRYDNVGVVTFQGFVPEPVGNSLCTSYEGTEYNKPDTVFDAEKKIISIFQKGKGDAALGRGACQEQLRISGRDKNPPICRPKEWRQKLGDFKKPVK